MVLEECPFCHKFLAAELMAKQEVATREFLKEKDIFFKTGISFDTGERITDDPEAFLTYRFVYRCKNCGKEWSKYKVEEIHLTKDYAEDAVDEIGKTEEDADEEAEEAREEEYVRED